MSVTLYPMVKRNSSTRPGFFFAGRKINSSSLRRRLVGGRPTAAPRYAPLCGTRTAAHHTTTTLGLFPGFTHLSALCSGARKQVHKALYSNFLDRAWHNQPAIWQLPPLEMRKLTSTGQVTLDWGGATNNALSKEAAYTKQTGRQNVQRFR